MTDEIQVAWAAGIYEGEGTTGMFPSEGRRYRVFLRIVMRDRDILERVALALGGKVYSPSRSDPLWKWQCTNRVDQLVALRKVWPYLGERRREQAAPVIAYLEESLRAMDARLCKCGCQRSLKGMHWNRTYATSDCWKAKRRREYREMTQ